MRVYRAWNIDQETSLGDAILLAETSAERRQGLLRHDRLESGSGLWIGPCEAVHTYGMKFAIDVLFLDRRLRVTKAFAEVGPGRVRWSFRAASVLELPGGTLAAAHVAEGDAIRLTVV